MSQCSFASAEYAMRKKRTRREKFLAEMERLVPWSRLISVIEPLYRTCSFLLYQCFGRRGQVKVNFNCKEILANASLSFVEVRSNSSSGARYRMRSPSCCADPHREY